MASDLAIKQTLISTLFVGWDGVDASSATAGTSPAADQDGSVLHEKLLFCVRVREDEDVGGTKKNKGEGKSNAKARFICITVKKNLKIRIHKVKQEKTSSFSISKTWSLDDIKSIENADDLLVVINVGRAYNWTLDTTQKKIELLFTLLQKYLKKLPKFVNLDERILKAQLAVEGALSAEKDPTVATNVARSPQKDNGEDGSNEDISVEKTTTVDSQAIDLEEVLSGFNWEAGGDAADLELRLNAELQALEAANVHAIIQSEEQANVVIENIEKALTELEVLEDWLAHYTNLLDRMGQDVHQIEAKNNAMQIASVNQKLLMAELEKLLGSLRVPGYVIEILRNEPLDDPEGVTQCEEATSKLMALIQTKFEDNMGGMQAVKERIALFNGYATQFATRLCDFLMNFFKQNAEAHMNERSSRARRANFRLYPHEAIEEKLFVFRQLLKWLKGVDPRKHHELQLCYAQEMGVVYRKELREFLETMRAHLLLKRTQEDIECLFLSQVPSISVTSAASNALKTAVGGSRTNLTALSPQSEKSVGTGLGFDTVSLTGSASAALASGAKSVKNKLEALRPSIGGSPASLSAHRRKKVTDMPDDDDDDNDGHSARGHRSRFASEVRGPSVYGLRGGGGGSTMNLDVSADDRMPPDEAVEHALNMLMPIMIREQNAAMDVFNIIDKNNPSPSAPSPEIVPIAIRTWQEGLERPREAIKDVKVQRRVQEIVETLFSEIKEEFLLLIDAGLKFDQTLAVPMVVRVEEQTKVLENTSHVFLAGMLEAIMKRLQSCYERFMDEQIKGIEDTKVGIKKRSGILPFVRTFPRFVDRTEKHLARSDGQARQMVNKVYERAVSTILETVDAVAKEFEPDKTGDDHINIHILTIENMHHFYSELRLRKVPVLELYIKQSKHIYESSLSAYMRIVIRKPLGKLLEFFEGIEEILKTSAPEEVSYHLQFSKSALKEVVKKYPGKEVKKGLESLYKRVERHFPDIDSSSPGSSPGTGGGSGSGGLLQVVWRGIQEELARTVQRYEELIGKCYPESGVHIEFTIEELLGYFSELARAH
ncbi:exocyst complex component Sec3-domain-containing protein [Cladochytrium replicatum]|nr:exocyst complex component Sec3-domain-containing protein [Cladochytrium replicatum]